MTGREEEVRDDGLASPAQPEPYVSPGEVFAREYRAARDYFEIVPPFCIQAEEDGSYTLHRKAFQFTAHGGAAAATLWVPVSRHPDLEEAERRLRHVCGPKLYYDGKGRITGAPPSFQDWLAMPR
ncbi:hypothetical protein [Roseicella frigidaeris]|uniref:Uncharacterized protein n=1 Tax=Roseicella frigidaeris TaxID=2230885 RepID=A0A327MDK0_9PROT|nr:hypothetical protein [Roseicella frigidaeris]RAI60655.1 hypothetical protein DOO78_00520 [Roseicella frigidaeris]